MKIDRQKLANVIRSLEGVDDEVKSQLMGLLNEKKSYGLVWEDKPEDAEAQMCDKLPVLQEVTSRRIQSEDPTAPNHVLIEGDNLHALTSLCYTHEGNIDVIYIDPPYNTGNKDFIYNDSYVDAEDGYRHSKWLSFMKRRLSIAKRLLSDKGVVFISIDDNEQALLKILCDQVFGGHNFLGNYIWRKKYGGGQAVDYFCIEHEYICAYRKSSNMYWRDLSVSRSPKEYNHKDEKGLYKTTKLAKWGNTSRKEDRPSMYYPITSPDNNDCFPIAPDGNDGRWRVGKDKMKEIIDKNLIHWENKQGKWIPYEKEYYIGQNKIIKTRSILYDIAETGDGSNTLTDIFNHKDLFLNPKPIQIITTLLNNVTDTTKKFTILDFFAGSGTTLHATMQLNAEDGGHRQCILVTNNENGICENVTYERNKRVIEGYTTPKGEDVEGLKANNLRYYKTGFIDRERTSRNMRTMMKMATDMLCIKEDLYDEVDVFGQLKKNHAIYRYFRKGDKQMLVIYREDFIDDFISEIEKMELAQPIHVYVFSPSNDPFSESFDVVADKVNLVALPAAIYEAYKEVLPPKKETLLPEFESLERQTNTGEKEVTLDNLFD